MTGIFMITDMQSDKMEKCNICPRNCNVSRTEGKTGFCGIPGNDIYVARAALHMWEEPCISGENGSGAVFFSGCSLRCVYCQNRNISMAKAGRKISSERLVEIFLELQGKGAHNINLVTPTHYTEQIVNSLKAAKNRGLTVPVVYNCSGYEKVETLNKLEGLVDVYLTDFKYMESDIAEKYSYAKNYPDVAKHALEEMVRQQGKIEFGEKGIMKKGVIVRHLLLPNHVNNAKKVVKYVFEAYGDKVYLCLLNQYTPVNIIKEFPELSRGVTKREYEKLLDYAISIGVTQAFIQEGETGKDSFIPEFNCEGV